MEFLQECRREGTIEEERKEDGEMGMNDFLKIYLFLIL